MPGADVTLDVNGAAETVLEATGGRGADVVLDFVGENGTPALAIEIVRQGGTYLIVGYGGELQVLTMLLILKEATIIGNLVGSYGDLSELIALAAAATSSCTPSNTTSKLHRRPSTTSTTGVSTAVRC
jgi:NAD+-dependent secondary alcohol dehydrogenase Adh1